MTEQLAYSLKSWLAHRTREAGDCLVWTGAVDMRGHARIFYLKHSYRVHRLIYMLEHGLETLPSDFKIKKTCGRWGCIKSEHFQRYIIRAAAKQRCIYGHEFTEANTYSYRKLNGTLVRTCLACSRARRKGIDPRLEPVRAEKRPHGRQGYCARGHNLRVPLPSDDIYVLPNGERRCQICRRRAKREKASAPNPKTSTVH
jgi:hypothetical protein